jgi:hypothetical protein
MHPFSSSLICPNRLLYIYNLLIRTMQKRAAQSGDARNDADEMVATAAARNDPGIDVVGVELRRMLVVPASSLSASNVKRRIATILSAVRRDACAARSAATLWGLPLASRAASARQMRQVPREAQRPRALGVSCRACRRLVANEGRSVGRRGAPRSQRAQQPAPRRVRRRRDQRAFLCVAGKRLLLYSHSGNK